MDRETLERLAANPHYKMTPEQIEALHTLQEKDIRHKPSFPKHPTDFKRHPIMPQKDGDVEGK